MLLSEFIFHIVRASTHLKLLQLVNNLLLERIAVQQLLHFARLSHVQTMLVLPNRLADLAVFGVPKPMDEF